MNIVSTSPAAGQRPAAFTLLELMVVAAIIAMLLVMTVPAVTGMMQSNQEAQADNLMRASLMGARASAMKYQVVTGVRFQEDGHIVRVAAENMDETFTITNFRQVPIYDMKSIPNTVPEQFPGPWRVTVGRDAHTYRRTWWYDRWKEKWSSHPQWACGDRWFVFPVVLFSGTGRTVYARCRFRSDSGHQWYPTLDGAFGVATWGSSDDNGNMYEPHTDNQTAVTAPAIASLLRLFNYGQAQAYLRGTLGEMSENDWDVLFRAVSATGSDCTLDIQTGMIIREKGYDVTEWN